MFVTDGTCQDDLLDVLKMSNGAAALSVWQANLVARCHSAAYNQLIALVVARGYTLAQALTWDAGADFERSVTLHLVLVSGGAADSEAVSDKFVSALDWRPQLSDGPQGQKALPLTAGGVLIVPQGPVGQANTGPLARSHTEHALWADNPPHAHDWDEPHGP